MTRCLLDSRDVRHTLKWTKKAQAWVVIVVRRRRCVAIGSLLNIALHHLGSVFAPLLARESTYAAPSRTGFMEYESAEDKAGTSLALIQKYCWTVVNRWCLTMNDCWILGGIHRQAPFVLMSDYNWKNVWSPDIKGFVVTARELIGLQTFGYRREKGTRLGPGSEGVATYVSVDEGLALSSDLEGYQLAVALLESRGPLAGVALINEGAGR